MAKVIKKEGPRGTVWQADYFTPDGKRRRKNFPLKKDADAFLGKVLAAKKENRYDQVFNIRKESTTTFNQLCATYAENHKNQKSFHCSKQYLLAQVQEHFGEKYLSQISYYELESYRNRRLETPVPGGKKRTPAAVNREMALISHLLSKAVEWELLENSPFKGKLKLKEDNCREHFLNDQEAKALLKACDDLKTHSPYLRPLVETALLTGMRRGELLSLKWEQIKGGLIQLTETKSGKPRKIPVNVRLEGVLKELRQRNGLKSEYVFCDPQGRRMHEVKRSFASACKRAGLDGFRFHDLRHSFASALVKANVNLKVVQELLGHASLTMTMRYSHLAEGELHQAVALLNGIGNDTGEAVDTTLTLKAQNAKRAADR